MQAIYTEFERLRRMSVGGTVADARSNRNARLNRYSNVLPYDANRVRLANTAKDYINASLLESPPGEQPKWRYIATQVGLVCSMLNSLGLHYSGQCNWRWAHVARILRAVLLLVCWKAPAYAIAHTLLQMQLA